MQEPFFVSCQHVVFAGPWFLRGVPSAECAKGGGGGYNNALQMDSDDFTGIAGLTDGQVTASSFRTYYVPLNTQQDFIDAYQVSLSSLLCSCNASHYLALILDALESSQIL